MRIFSAVQPTGELHIGNYLGAIRQWVNLQERNDCLFCVVDLHALTSPYNPKDLQDLIREKIIIYLASGINPNKSAIFIQSKISEHSELAWILNTVTPVGDLKRMTQFKEKSEKFKEINAGLLNYPLLMASDILLYQTEVVPVGIDQKQHIELTRTIAKKFNKKFGETFKVPKAHIPGTGAKIMSLTDPKKKMSKSDKEESRIGIFDSPEKIKSKIMKATTDSQSIVEYDPVNKPGLSNLLTIYSVINNRPVEEIGFKSYKDLKTELAESLISFLSPFREKLKEIKKEDIDDITSLGEEKARKIAKETMQKVRENMGLVS